MSSLLLDSLAKAKHVEKIARKIRGNNFDIPEKQMNDILIPFWILNKDRNSPPQNILSLIKFSKNNL